MGFKVTIRRNGAVCGEAHYKAEAVAAGMADKATKANPDVSAAVTRCNGSACGCGTKTNRRPRALPRRNGADPFAAVRRAVKKEVSRYAEEGGTFATQRLMDAAYRAYNKHMTATGVQLPVEMVTAEIVAARTQAEDLHRGQTQGELRRVVSAEREAARHRFPRHNGSGMVFTQAPSREATMRAVEVGDIPGPFTVNDVGTPAVDDARGRTVALFPKGATKAAALFAARLNALMPHRRNSSTAGAMAASRSMAYSNLFRNGGTRPTFDAARKRIFREFGEAGWTLSSPTLKVLHATSPDGKCRAWFKAQSIYYTKGGGTHELGTAHSVTQGFDLRAIAPGIFVRWFEKNWCGPTRTNPTRRRAARVARTRRNPGSMTEAQASTLIRQMGGMGKLTAMLGASGFGRGSTDGHPSLTFKFKGSKKANVVTIILDPSDTYTLRFAKMASAAKFYEVTPAGEFSGVYADALKPTFERFTGLYLSL